MAMTAAGAAVLLLAAADGGATHQLDTVDFNSAASLASHNARSENTTVVVGGLDLAREDATGTTAEFATEQLIRTAPSSLQSDDDAHATGTRGANHPQLEVPRYAECEVEWPLFVKTFNRRRHWEPDEERRSIFCANLRQIKQHNERAHEYGWSMGISERAAWNKHEIADATGEHNRVPMPGEVAPASRFVPSNQSSLSHSGLPSSVDFRHVMPPVQNQGRCGGCWAYATTAMVDFWTNVQNPGTKHSEQQILDCWAGPGSHGCQGGNVEGALRYLQLTGHDSNSTYATTAGSSGVASFCKHNSANVAAIISDRAKFLSSEADLAVAAATQVVAKGLFLGSTNAWLHYKSGVFNDPTCGADKQNGHVVAIVGYTPDYWIARNSWGPQWGVAGHMYLKRGVNICNINNNGGAVARAQVGTKPIYSPPPILPACPSSSPVCTCNTKTKEVKQPCYCHAGTDCSRPFSGCTFCGRPFCAPFMQQGDSICDCTSQIGATGSASVACACGNEDCNHEFSSCKLCDTETDI
jgi:hypothetical protein